MKIFKISNLIPEVRSKRKEKKKLLKENKRLEEIRDRLLPKLMSGEIDVSKIDLMQLNSHLA